VKNLAYRREPLVRAADAEHWLAAVVEVAALVNARANTLASSSASPSGTKLKRKFGFSLIEKSTSALIISFPP
jgi:hypothetical protein